MTASTQNAVSAGAARPAQAEGRTSPQIANEYNPTHLEEDLFNEDLRDNTRILLIEMVHLLGACLKDREGWAAVSPQRDHFGELVKNLHKLAVRPGHNGELLIHSVGGAAGQGPAYVVHLGNTSVDMPGTAEMIQRKGAHMGFLAGLLEGAFGVFNDRDFDILHLTIPGYTPQAVETLRLGLQILAACGENGSADGTIEVIAGGQLKQLAVIADANGRPDPNLTLVAGINHMNAQAARELVLRISAWLQGRVGEGPPRPEYVNVFEALFGIRGLKLRLLRPPVEVNNVKWLLGAKGRQGLTAAQGLLARQVARSDAPIRARQGRLLASLYADFHDATGAERLAEELQIASELLGAMASSADEPGVRRELLRRVQMRFDRLAPEVFEALTVEGSHLTVGEGENRRTFTGLERDLVKVVAFYRQRYATRSKLRAMAASGVNFEQADYEVLATEYGLAAEDLADIVALLGNCFDDRGRFRRGAFETHLEDFARFEEMICEFLWIHFKEAPDRQSRLAFLQSLGQLIARTRRAQNGIRVLLEDFIGYPAGVAFSDRNALLLAIQLLRSYHKELDIEMTPEEVLLVRDGLSPDHVQAALAVITRRREALFTKVRAIHKRLRESLDPATAEASTMSWRYLLSLERELYIFLSLVGGPNSGAILRSALKRYGNPEADLFIFTAESNRQTTALLQQLKVLVRTLARLAAKRDISLLNDIRSREQAFLRLGEGDEHTGQVERVMSWVDRVREEIIQSH